MARTRDLKPSFFKNEVLAECEPLARLLFAGLWTLADREGRLEDRPKKIKAEVIPYDNCDCDAMLSQLAEHGFIIRYRVNDIAYIQIVTFKDHQKFHPNEQASKLPEPAETLGAVKRCDSVTEKDNQGDTEQVSCKPLPSLPSFTSLPSLPPNPQGGDFAEWYSRYPNKVGRGGAERAFKAALRKTDPETLLEALEIYIRTKPPDRPWCNPATWLNQERWLDQPQNVKKGNGYDPNAALSLALADKTYDHLRTGGGDYRQDVTALPKPPD